MLKKLLAQLLAVVMLLSLVLLGAVGSMTVSAEISGDFEYSASNGEVTITRYIGSSRDAVIPSAIDGYPVTGIGPDAFKMCGLESITIPPTLKKILGDSFFRCSGLKAVYITDLAAWCDLDVISVGNPLWLAGNLYLNGKLVTDLVIPASVNRVKDWVFLGCDSLKSVTISDGVENIGVAAFYNCNSLENIVIPDSVETIGQGAFQYCSSLKKVTLCDGVKSLSEDMFYYCSNLKSITIPKSVKQVGDGAFSGCTSLENVYYRGTEKECASMTILDWNDHFKGAKWYYSSCIGKAKHTYTNACDTSCNVCAIKRTIKHAYKTTVTAKATLTKNGSAVKRCSVCDKLASKTTIKYPKTFKLSATSYTYDGKVKSPTVTVKDSAGKTLKKGVDYTVTYASGRKNVGTYKVTVKMIGKYTGTKTLSFKINPVKIAKCKLKLSADVYAYNGAAKTPSVVVKNAAGKTLKKGTDYTVTYASGRKNVGTYKVTVKMKGNYSGSKTLTFKINPPKTGVAKLTAGKKTLTVSITKKTKQVSGYQIQYSTSKSFSGATTKTVASYKTTKLTLKSLKTGKTYYVRVRTYKTVNGKKVYSDWSAYKSTKVK